MALVNFTGIEIKNLFSKPVTTQYPFVPAEYKERTRGHIENDMDQCILCGLCQMRCPTGAITVDKQGQTWEIRPFSCIQCRCCVDNCPKKSLSMKDTYQEPGSEKLSLKFDLSEGQKAALKEQARVAAERAAAAKAKAAEAAKAKGAEAAKAKGAEAVKAKATEAPKAKAAAEKAKK